ncbi:hypothetical protein D3C78_1069390 [compost metagenome]
MTEKVESPYFFTHRGDHLSSHDKEGKRLHAADTVDVKVKYAAKSNVARFSRRHAHHSDVRWRDYVPFSLDATQEQCGEAYSANRDSG